jgi:hypothetical protein
MAKDMMFCPYCGSKVQADESTVGYAGNERVEGVIPLAVAKDGPDEGKLFTLVITKMRLLFAKVTDEDSGRIQRASGSLLMGGAILDPERHRKTMGAYSIRYLMMDPETILAESTANERLKLTDVKSVKISSEEDTEGNQSYLLTIETDLGSRRFQIPTDKDSRDLLISTFGSKVHW